MVDGVSRPGERQLRRRGLGTRRRRCDEPDARRGCGAVPCQGGCSTTPSSCTTRSSTARRVRVMVIRNDLRWATERATAAPGVPAHHRPRDLAADRVRGVAPLGTPRPGSAGARTSSWPSRRAAGHMIRDRPLGHRGGVSRGRRSGRPRAMPSRSTSTSRPASCATRRCPADVRAALDDAGLAAHWLVLEVTESVLDLAHDVRMRLDELRACGVGLSIDDFGTGYSSLARVGELPVRELKIDRSLLVGRSADAQSPCSSSAPRWGCGW